MLMNLTLTLTNLTLTFLQGDRRGGADEPEEEVDTLLWRRHCCLLLCLSQWLLRDSWGRRHVGKYLALQLQFS